MELFANHCRLCRAENDPTESWPQLTQTGNEHLLEKIQACTGVQILADDGLPKRICRRCETSLDQADTFRLQCREADAWWRFNFGESVAKPIPITSIYVKPEVVEEDELDEGNGHRVEVEAVLKEEPMKQEDSDYEPTKEESSSDESEKDSSKKQKKKTKKKATPKKRGRTEHRCSVCAKLFRQKVVLDEHEARHTGIKNIACTQCDCMFFGIFGLRKHEQMKHATNLPFKCDKCDKRFALKHMVQSHQLSHSDERPFSCELCPKAFKVRAQLTAHMKYVHQPPEVKEEQKKAFERICVCAYCGHISKSVTAHKIHLRIHTGEKNYECQICGKRFAASFSYRKHLLIHTGEKPHQCEYCDKAFRARNHLKTHVRALHTNERPYQCRFCAKAFVTKQSMQIHEKTHGEPVVGLEFTQ